MNNKKYTAAQWSQIEGGHTIEPDGMNKLQLVHELTESRLFRNKKIAGDVNLDDAAELVFVQLMMLNVFNKDYDFAPLAREYASRSMAFRNFDTFRTSGTDLYIALNRIMGKDQKIITDKDKIAASRLAPNKTDLIRYLDNISKSKSNPDFEKRMLLRFERQLNIQSSMLKSLRRLSSDWENLNQNQRALVVTRMSQYIRQKAMRSELTPALLKFQKRGNYIINDTGDKKKKIWKNPIVKTALGIAGAVAAVKGARALGKHLGKTSYQTGRNLGKRYPKTGSTK